MSRIVRLAVCLILMAEVMAARAADELASTPAGEQAVRQIGQETVWSNPDNYLRPHKGVRFEHGRSAGPMLLWVLCSPNGQPLAVSLMGETKVDDYFRSRLEAKLAEVTVKQSLHREQVDKLVLAAQVDLARLTRLAQRTDCELAKSDGENEPRVNKMLHALAIACDHELFDEKSLFSRVLATQLAAK